MPLSGELIVSFFMLLLMEIALGIDNVIFVGLLAERLPSERRRVVWRFWLIYSPLLRTALLLGAFQVLQMKWSFMEIKGHPLGIRELLLIGGGLFLLYKAVREIHRRTEGEVERFYSSKSALLQVAFVDFVFSADSVLTAIGMSRSIGTMISVVVISMIVMVIAAQRIQQFISRHPTLKMLALAFLLLIGLTLVAEGTGLEIPRGYIYFAMLFSLGVELLNLRAGLREKDA
ncbi:MAG: TerC family protein [Bacteroidia bacterium]|nr:TerC family protein [Bacteroidia bacterium]MCX7763474.1 TerC family protein [Bacteroidia bacterium]MDW8058019.1 TerC family protein [Bacteroidia bacterium]